MNNPIKRFLKTRGSSDYCLTSHEGFYFREQGSKEQGTRELGFTPVNKLKVSTTREVKNKSEVKFLKKYRLHAA